MSTDRDTTRIVRSWLRTDEHESADRVLDNVLALLDATPQRRSLVAGAEDRRHEHLRQAGGSGRGRRRRRGRWDTTCCPRSGGAGAEPDTDPSSSPAPSVAAAARRSAFRRPVALTAGRHTLTEDDTVFSMEVPDGWSQQRPELRRMCAPTAAGCSGAPTTRPTRARSGCPSGVSTASRPTRAHARRRPVATSAAELADAVATILERTWSRLRRTSSSVADPAKHVVIKVRADIDCSARQFNMWADPGHLPLCDGARPDEPRLDRRRSTAAAISGSRPRPTRARARSSSRRSRR